MKMAPNFSTISRSFSTLRVLRSSMAEPLKVQASQHGEHKDGWKVWRKVFFLVCIPAMGLATLNVLVTEEPPPPEFKPYSHLRIRNCKFPWRDGNKSLFHNPHTNALPDGYEHVSH